jgi:signal transduction histidine kinase
MLYFPLDSPLFLLHVLGLVVTAGVSLAAARWVRGQTRDRAGDLMTYLLATHAIMAVALIAQLLTSGLGLKAVFRAVWALLLFTNPVAWFLFAVYYTGRNNWLTAPTWAILGLSALVPAALVVANLLGDPILVEYELRTDPFRHVVATNGGVASLLFLGGFVYNVIGFGLLLKQFLFSRRASRWQSLALLAGIAAIFVPAFLSGTSLAPVYLFPYGVYGAGVFGVIVAVALFRTRMFAVAPLARDTLFDSLSDAVVVVDARHRIVDFNDRAAALFPDVESRAGDDLGTVYPHLLDEGSSPLSDILDAPDALSAADDGETPFAGVIQRTVDGETRTFRVSTSTITSGGEPRGYGIVVRDVTDLVEYATELERETERLQQFASVLSHDLRNPVTIAMGRLEHELAGREDEAENVEIALSAVDRINDTIDDLLTLAREGERVVDPDAVSLRAVAEDAWETSDTGDATLAVELDRDVRIRADRSRLRTMLENLFRNAVDHGGESVTVGSADAGFCVADDGPGIPEDDRETVFEYGYSTREDGTGFGLAIVASIAEAHDWSVSVRDAVADGGGDGATTPAHDAGARFEISGVTTV